MSKWQVGDTVCSQSGLAYVVIEVCPLDEHGSMAYRVRRLRGGEVWGPTRLIAECDLFPGR